MKRVEMITALDIAIIAISAALILVAFALVIDAVRGKLWG